MRQTAATNPPQGTGQENCADPLAQHGIDVRLRTAGEGDAQIGISTPLSSRTPDSLSPPITTSFPPRSPSPLDASPQTPSSPSLNWRPYQGPATNVLSDLSLQFLRSSPSQSSLRTLKAVRRHKLQKDAEAIDDVDTRARPSMSAESANKVHTQKRDFLASVRRRVASLARPLRKGKAEEPTTSATGSSAMSLGVENIPGTPLRRARSATILEEVEVPKIKKAQIDGLDEATIEASRRARDISSKWKYDAVEDEENSE